MMTLLTILLGLLLFALGVCLVHVTNEPVLQRSRQLPLPLLAALYGLLGLFYLEGFSVKAHEFSTWLVSNIPFFGNLNAIFFDLCILNFMLLAFFAIVKLVYGDIFAILAKWLPDTATRMYGILYCYDEEHQHWYLRDKYRGARKLLRVLYVSALVMAAVLFAASAVWEDASVFSNAFYPALAALVLGEAYYALSGLTRAEYLDDIEFEDDGGRRIFQYAKLQEVLRHYFDDRIMLVTSRGSRKSSLSTHDEFCQDLIRSDDFPARLAGGYFKALSEKGLLGKTDDADFDELNHDLVLTTVRLLQGKSVMIASPFYRDFVPYVFLPVNAQLIRNKKVLVVYGPEMTEDALRGFVSDGLDFVTGIPEMWTIDQLRVQGNRTPDVGLIPFSSLGDTQLILGNAAYLRDVSFVLVVDPSSLLATYQIGLSILAEHLSYGQPVHYCILDRNSDGLVDSLSHALRTNLVEVTATEYAEASSVGLFWQVDGEPLQHRLVPGIAQYLGVGSEIGFVALKSQVEKVAWASHTAVPLADQRWIVGQYYGELLRFAELPQEQLQIDEKFSFYDDMWAMPKTNNQFVIAEDEYRNLFEAFRQFSTRGTEQAFVNVLSPNYLLREYMIENAEVFAADPKAVPSLAPDFSKSQRNVIFSIVMVMAQSGSVIGEAEVKARLKYAGLEVENVLEALRGLLIDHIDFDEESKKVAPEDHIVMYEVEEYDPANREIVARRRFGLNEDAQYAECFSSLRNVPLITEQAGSAGQVLGSRLYGHVYQTFLPGQFLAMHGKYYEVVSISKKAGVVLRRAADHFSDRHYYRQLRTCKLEKWMLGEGLGDVRTVSNVTVKRIAADFSIGTQGYLKLANYGDIAHAKRVELSGIPTRHYKNKYALRLEFPGATHDVTVTLAALIGEFMVTLFPKDYEYVTVVTPCDEALPDGVLPRFEGEKIDGAGVIYILEDSLIDIGLVSCVDRNVARILELCWDYLDWHTAKLAGVQEAREEYELGEIPEFIPPEVRKGFFRRLLDKLKGLLGGRGGKGGKSAEGAQDDAGGAGGASETPPAEGEMPNSEAVDAPDVPEAPAEPEADASPDAFGESEETEFQLTDGSENAQASDVQPDQLEAADQHEVAVEAEAPAAPKPPTPPVMPDLPEADEARKEEDRAGE